MVVGLLLAWAWLGLLVFALAVVSREAPADDQTSPRIDGDHEASN